MPMDYTTYSYKHEYKRGQILQWYVDPRRLSKLFPPVGGFPAPEYYYYDIQQLT